ncbi:hypothetical protein BVAD3_18510 [Bacillus velezensis]|nr:hypothetical protein BVAD3_18510 [Bacillus velezensis]
MLAKWLGGILLIGLLVYAGWNIYSVQKSPKEGTEEGMKAPDFTLDTLSGKSISLSDYKGKKSAPQFLGDVVQTVPNGNARYAGAAERIS